MFALIVAMALSSNFASAHAQESGPNESHRGTGAMKISINTGEKVITATLRDSATTRDFVAMLPMTLTLEDYAETEKISYLPRKLSTEGAPAGSEPAVGDIAYYAPWGNLAIFYKSFRYSSGLVPLGNIDSGWEALNVPGTFKAKIELIQE